MKLQILFCTHFVVSLLALSEIKKNLTPRIIGGNNAVSGQFPFAAAIHITTSDGKYFCGGSLISNQWVVTAGQCVDGALLFSIQLGSTTLTKNDSNRLVLATSEYVLHPEYNSQTLENDIGLIRLRMPVELTNYVMPVYALPEEALEDSTRVLVLGWGQTSDDDPELSENLQYIAITTLSNEECKLTYGNQIVDTMVCVDGNYNEGSCNGDTGSPLIQIISMGHARLVGISSFISYNGCESTDPSGFTRIFPYMDWIKNVTDVSV